ncbi:hypothetical protein Z948_3202 [Sulfitobacter donghicola DSW-25 = KCTC 12864 = JCM 14565]|nr:hypothetical protein Z948_3202 [Sulfitobacter donghicola DSW-25 = KCTC 12864 = JCM 14565]
MSVFRKPFNKRSFLEDIFTFLQAALSELYSLLIFASLRYL